MLTHGEGKSKSLNTKFNDLTFQEGVGGSQGVEYIQADITASYTHTSES